MIAVLLQVILNHLYLGQNIKESIDAPRLHHQLLPMAVIASRDTPKVRSKCKIL
jgi:gamma-glutamyltranspeptidase